MMLRATKIGSDLKVANKLSTLETELMTIHITDGSDSKARQQGRQGEVKVEIEKSHSPLMSVDVVVNSQKKFLHKKHNNLSK